MPERQCAGCTHQKEWGCEAVQLREPDPDEDPRDAWLNPASIPLPVDGEETYACPRQPLHRDPGAWSKLLLYYGMYKNGFLPQAGAVMNQSNRAIDMFRILDAVNAQCDEELARDRRRQAGPPQGMGGR